MSREKYIVEVRDAKGQLDFKKEEEVRKAHPFLFSKREFTIDDLCHYAAFGQGRDLSIGPNELPPFMESIGACYCRKTW